MSCFRST